MNPDISVIMPAYNAAQYIREALDSLSGQSFQNFEIVLLNDGSKDSTASICTEYAGRDGRIRFVDKENEGVAITRNRALDMANGEYVIFIDSDDIIYPDSLQKIHDVIVTKQPDFLRYEYQCIDESGKACFPNYQKRKREKYSGCVMNSMSFMKNVMLDEYYLCMNVFKRSILNEYNIRFMPGCTYNEDTLFIVQYLTHSKTHIYTPVLVYGYRKYSGAVTSHFTEKNYEDVKRVFKELQQLYYNTDAELKQHVRAVVEHIGLTIYGNASTFYDFRGKDRVISFCTSSPITLDWKIISLMGCNFYNYIILIINIIKKIKRKLLYLCGR